jgi:hypothetical protein
MADLLAEAEILEKIAGIGLGFGRGRLAHAQAPSARFSGRSFSQIRETMASLHTRAHPPPLPAVS